MSVEIKVKVAPFEVPIDVRPIVPTPDPMSPLARLGYESPPRIPLGELDADSLSALCARFRRDVFEKAGKADPLNAVRGVPPTKKRK